MIGFGAALAQTDQSQRYLLLGNGFSISLFPKCFTYDSLFGEAKASGLFNDYPEIESAFRLLETNDFELIMEALKNFAKLAPLYGGG